VAVDAQGNAVVIGFFRETMDWHGPQPLVSAHPETSDLFIVKIDADFNYVWDRVWGDAANQGDWFNEDLALDEHGNIYVSASFEGTVDTGVNVHTCQGAFDVLVAKLKP
jgi:hypothetical protein